MTSPLDAIFLAFSILLALPLLYCAIEIAVGLKPQDIDEETPESCPVTVVIIPAHNEAEGIGRTIQNMQRSLPSAAEILVVADNCTDETAKVASASGALAISRDDKKRRGKGFALAFARDYLESRDCKPEAVVVIDADCKVSPNLISATASRAHRIGRPVQALNLLTVAADGAPIRQISAFAFLIKNLLRARGMFRIAGGITLLGTGMALPWSMFSKAPLATGNVVEDLRLSLSFAEARIPIDFYSHASVHSPAAPAEDTMEQRRRWETGFLHTAVERALPLLVKGLASFSRYQVGVALHLMIPPITLLAISTIVGLAATFAYFLWTGSALAFSILLLVSILAFCVFSIAWWKEGRTLLPFSNLIAAPRYIAGKLPIYLDIARARKTSWTRTPRVTEEEDADGPKS